MACSAVVFGYFSVERGAMIFVLVGLDVGLGGDQSFGSGGSFHVEALFEHFVGDFKLGGGGGCYSGGRGRL